MTESVTQSPGGPPTFDNVIIFGPTGDVGGAAALEAGRRGATVWLAMRDTTKTIPAIAPEAERRSKFRRLQADLQDVASITNAVERSGAGAAYMYLVHPSSATRYAVQALKRAGIRHVVFLSSWSLRPGVALTTVPAGDLIAHAHAQGELALAEAGLSFTALRPAVFASNLLRLGQLDTAATPMRLYTVAPNLRSDNIDPADVGRAAGALLVNHQQHHHPSSGPPSDRPDQQHIYLCGPELSTASEMADIITRVTGRTVQLTHVDQAGLESRLANKVPEPLATYLAGEMAAGRMQMHLEHEQHELVRGADNVRKYAGKEPTKFADYVGAHKDAFTAGQA